MKSVTIKNNQLVVSFDYDPLLVNIVRGLPGATFHKPTKSWLLPVDVLAEKSVQVLMNHGFAVAEAVTTALIAFERFTQAPITADKVVFPPTITLRPFQEYGVAFLKQRGSALLGDEPGLGKTIQALCVTHDQPKVLVLTFTTLKEQFASEIRKFLPESTYTIIQGSPSAREELWQRDTQYYICNYEQLLKDISFMQLTYWDYIVADECTRLSNHTGQQYKALQTLQAKHKLAMTGTAVSNSPLDIYGIINWLYPKSLGSFYAFSNRYVIKDFFGSPRQFIHMDELAERIKPYFLRRTKEQVLPDLPDKVLSTVPVQLSQPERKLYDNIKKMLIDELLGAEMNKVEFVSQLQNGVTNMLRLRQVCDSMELVGEETHSSKMSVLKDMLTTLPNRKMIIFSEFAEMCKLLHADLENSLMIIGEVPQGTRDAIVQEFNTSSTRNILVMSSAGAYGLNLQAADVIIHYDLPWSVAKLQQREARAHRMGQKNTVFIYSLIAQKSVDEYVQKKLALKQDLAEQVLPLSELKELLQ